MGDFTQILSAIERGDTQAADDLLPLVYDELRKLAAQRLTQEKPGQTLQATALVHEAYLRLVGGEPSTLPLRQRRPRAQHVCIRRRERSRPDDIASPARASITNVGVITAPTLARPG